jgi:hypothetical protein
MEPRQPAGQQAGSRAEPHVRGYPVPNNGAGLMPAEMKE